MVLNLPKLLLWEISRQGRRGVLFYEVVKWCIIEVKLTKIFATKTELFWQDNFWKKNYPEGMQCSKAKVAIFKTLATEPWPNTKQTHLQQQLEINILKLNCIKNVYISGATILFVDICDWDMLRKKMGKMSVTLGWFLFPLQFLLLFPLFVYIFTRMTRNKIVNAAQPVGFFAQENSNLNCEKLNLRLQ